MASPGTLSKRKEPSAGHVNPSERYCRHPQQLGLPRARSPGKRVSRATRPVLVRGVRPALSAFSASALRFPNDSKCLWLLLPGGHVPVYGFASPRGWSSHASQPRARPAPNVPQLPQPGHTAGCLPGAGPLTAPQTCQALPGAGSLHRDWPAGPWEAGAPGKALLSETPCQTGFGCWRV